MLRLTNGATLQSQVISAPVTRMFGGGRSINLRVVDKPVHFRDIHTAIRRQLGLDQNRVTYLHMGRE